MLHLSWPRRSSSTNFASTNYTRLKPLLRTTRINLEEYYEFLNTNTFVLDSNTIAGGLLRHLSIDPDWDLDYLISYVRLRSYSLATPFKITSISNLGSVIKDELYREGTLERWVLIENNEEYDEETLDNSFIKTLSPIIPLYSTTTKRSYLPTTLKDNKSKNKEPDLAIIGIDLVELAIGWWYRLRKNETDSLGVETYLNKFVFPKTQLYQNQLAVINMLYEFFINGVTPDYSIEFEKNLPYTTVNEDRYLKDVVNQIIKSFNSRRLVSVEHLLDSIPSIYQTEYFNFIDSGKSGSLAQSSWIWEPAVLKIYAIYLAIANRNGYKASDVNNLVTRIQRVMPRNIDRINDRDFREHIKKLSEVVFELNDKNYK